MVLYFLLWWTVRPSQNQNKYKVGYTMSRKIESANFALKLCANLCVKESFWKHDDSIQEQKKILPLMIVLITLWYYLPPSENCH